MEFDFASPTRAELGTETVGPVSREALAPGTREAIQTACSGAREAPHASRLARAKQPSRIPFSGAREAPHASRPARAKQLSRIPG
ncbi:MAG TPA: hypothetical protein VIK01_27060, partial [Polyangiaceae bacterium]